MNVVIVMTKFRVLRTKNQNCSIAVFFTTNKMLKNVPKYLKNTINNIVDHCVWLYLLNVGLYVIYFILFVYFFFFDSNISSESISMFLSNISREHHLSFFFPIFSRNIKASFTEDTFGKLIKCAVWNNHNSKLFDTQEWNSL